MGFVNRNVQPDSVAEINMHEILDPVGVFLTAQAEGLGLCPCLSM